ncbi:MAG: ATP--guanido phosphotransferase [Anaerococcus sp.]|nr:ATP--guanido phosphotransferase [Anaerococcus sp.]
MIDYSKDIILNSNLSLRRNIKGFDFPKTMTLDDSLKVIDIFRKIYGDKLILLEDLDETSLNKLLASFALSKNFDKGSRQIGLVFEDDYILTINDKDHLAINIIDFNMDIKNAYKKAMEVEGKLDKVMDFAFSAKLGFLTSSARNTGSGLEIFLKTFLFGLIDSNEAYFGLKQALMADGIFINKYRPYRDRPYSDDIYILKNVGNYRKDMDSYLAKIEENLDVIVRNERRFRRDYKLLNKIEDEEIEDKINLILNNLDQGLLKSLDQIVKNLYELKKYRALDFDTRLSPNEIDYLIFNLSKTKYKGNRNERRYKFLKEYMEGR